MISLITHNDLQKTSIRLDGSLFEVKQNSQILCYGDGCDVWYQPPELRITRVSQMVTLCGVSSDMSELKGFIACIGGEIEGSAALLSHILPIKKMRILTVLTTPRSDYCGGVVVPQRLSQVYDLLCLSDDSFSVISYDAWLADFSYRCRHGFARCFTIEEGGTLVATVSVLFHDHGRAIGGALAVHPEFRGRGYGIRLLGFAATDCAAKGETLFIYAADEIRAEYYRKYGWKNVELAATGTL